MTVLVDRPAASHAVSHRPVADTLPTPAEQAGSSFRPDIEGLRTIAVTIVVLFHAGATVLSGGYVGVDVFFVISGFLITSQLLREWGRTGSIRISRFYARRMVRLLPASVFVVVLTLLAAWMYLPPLRLKELAVDALTTTFYGMNYRLAVEGTDYLGSTAPPSPLQHFWSLAVEEQFYLVWPLLLLGLLAATRRVPRRARTAVATSLALIIAGSFALSMWLTTTNAPWAYFGAHTRAWELAVGAFVAVWAVRVRPPRFTRATVLTGRWLGLAGIAAAAVLFTEQTAFPGYAAALPVAATALVIIVGCADSSSRTLGAPVMQFIGAHSYAWYLWHWPVIIIGGYAFTDLALPGKLGLAFLALLLAVITARKVEAPARTSTLLRSRTGYGLGLGALLSVALVAVSLGFPALAPPTTGTGADATDATAFLARSAAEKQLVALVEQSATVTTVPANLTPTVAKASGDVGQIYFDDCDLTFTEHEVKKQCVYGDLKSPTTVVLFGDSHAGHWFPAVNAIAQQRHWRLVVLTKAACSAATAQIYMPNLKRAYTECGLWRDATIAYLNTLQPKMIITSSNGHGDMLDPGDSQDTGWANAWTTTFNRFPKSAKIVLINDTAWPAGDAPTCVSNNLNSLNKCHRPRDAALADGRRRRLVADAARDHGGTVVDPAPWMCTRDVCPEVIGNVLVHKDDSHLSATYAKLVAPVLAGHIPQVR